jgi:feruloyl-CoA synthase
MLAPLVRDVVVTGHDRGAVGALLIPELEACRAAAGLPAAASAADVYANPALVAEIQKRLRALAAGQTGSSTRVTRVAFLSAALSLDAGEVTDKGSINQRAVLANRSALVEQLYAPTPVAAIISI